MSSTPKDEPFRDLAEAMFPVDDNGRLIGESPHLHLLRGADSLICRSHRALPDHVAEAIGELARRPRGRPSQWASDYAAYVDLLSSVAPLKAIRAGQLYGFPDLVGIGGSAIGIGEHNAELLRGGLDEWLPDVAAGVPMLAMIADGRAVAICMSVNASPRAHCAGVETLPAYRGRGLAGQAAAAWSKVVRRAGAAPYYGTTFDNIASQGVARRLGLKPIGSEFSIYCDLS